MIPKLLDSLAVSRKTSHECLTTEPPETGPPSMSLAEFSATNVDKINLSMYYDMPIRDTVGLTWGCDHHSQLEEEKMAKRISKSVHVLEFGCEAPLRFFEHCAACPRFDDTCPDLILGKAILRGKKKIVYGQTREEDAVHAADFNCLAPIYYFERSRKKCGHAGRCREEGLLLALLDRKKTLDYSRKEITELPQVRKRKAARVAKAKIRKATVSS